MNTLPRLSRSALATAAGALLLVGGTAGSTAAPVPPPESAAATDAVGKAPATPSTPSTRSTSAPTSLDVTALPRGPRPDLTYAVDRHPVFGDGDFHLVRGRSGERRPLPEGPLGDFVHYPGSGHTVLSYGTEAGAVVELVGRDGRMIEQQRGLDGYGLATTPSGDIVGWQQDDGRVRVLERGARRALELAPVRRGASLGALWGRGTCKEQAPEGGGCTAFLNTADDRRVWLTSSHGIVDTVPRVHRVVDVGPGGRLLGLVEKRGDHRGCWGVVTPRRVAWRTCERELVAFSPDGRHVAGVAGSRYWATTRGVTILDAAGATVADWRLGRGANRLVGQLVWEDAEHLLAVVSQGDTFAIVRFGVDGTAELAGPTIDVPDRYSPFRLPLA
ncbi:hypothetical protein GCM10023340_43760 [Nocardioides marinquilinus]|uniref:WD40 repeat domain-containing protein n=1 Tax=Nocardioides marinquilinus TaxID=1210400 RepID=A0ABP9Q371_9ACTN